MRGSTYKRCPCPVQYDARGNKKTCAKRHGTWWYRFDAGLDAASGKRHQIAEGGFGTQREAQAALSEAISEVSRSGYRDDRNLTLSSYLERWLDEKTAVLRETTMRDYRRYVEKQINPRLGRVRLRDLRTSQVSVFLRELTDGGLGATSTRRVHAVLRSALSDAVKAELVRSNAATNALVVKRPRPKVHPWTPEELGVFLDHAAADEYGPIFELIAGSGLRRGEALGLRWTDVDLDRGLLTVRQQVVQLDAATTSCSVCGEEHRGLAFGAPKTTSGDARRMELGQAATGVLLAHRLVQDEHRRRWGAAYNDHDLVFARADGNPIHPERVTKRFAKLVILSGVRHARLHDLRHARASLMLASGTDIALVSKMMGHSSVAITADTYAHLLDGVGRRAAEAADALVPRAVRAHSVHSVASQRDEAPSPQSREGL